ncbi:MAG TPA: protein kinase [Thermoanaerobaculia bacterium]|nr:protein kinase [Thermoanaerobaculia bacterium]
MSLSPGTRLGAYTILEPLGAGGMGEVYRARDTRLGREVAIKVLPEEFAADRERVARFEREAKSASALNHPNVVTIYEVGREGSAFFIAMELVEGQSLREIVSAGPLPFRRVLSLGSQIAEGLSRAHSTGIVHRDLKPENLMISRDGFVKILDFGLAKKTDPSQGGESQLETSGGSLTGGGVVLGTTAYMSPEQAGGRAVDFRSDQFALGCVLYEMASGVKPFWKETAVETLSSILRDDPTPLAAVDARLPAPLCWIIERCLAKDPEERYASTRDLAVDLSSLKERFRDATAPSARPSTDSALPLPRTGFVGREKEKKAIAELLRRPGVVLVTLTGPGGIGKSRLALEVARELAAELPGGSHFVPLEPVADPEAMASAILKTLGAREEDAGAPPLPALKKRLRAATSRPLLLLLDSFEHLLSAAPLVAEIASSGPGARILVTSRSPLHVYGEHEFPVPPLGLPDPRTTSVEELSRSEAIALFAQRAAAVKPDFAMTEESARATAEICLRLDGLPLAIELAAARVKLLTPAAMRARLEKRLQLLTGGARDLPARQQTLRGAIDWSHDLLTQEEQKLFRRLSVFAGGFTLEAAEAVCNAREDLGLDPLDGIGSLLDKSLLRESPSAAGEPRFFLLETIREYALERLAASGGESATRRAHAAYCLVLAEDKAYEQHSPDAGPPSPGLPPKSGASGATSTPSLEQFEVERENFRSALDWLIEHGEAEWGLRLGAALLQYWDEREHQSEGSDRLSKLLALPKAAAPTRLRARGLFALGVLSPDPASARALFEESLRISRELDDKRGIAVALNAVAVSAEKQGNLEESYRLFEESLLVWKDLGDPVAVARALSNMASVARRDGRPEDALALLEENLALSRALGDRPGAAWALNQQGDLARERGDREAAARAYSESLAMFREAGDRWGIAGTLSDLGGLARDGSDFDAAERLYAESLAAFQELDYKRGIARILDAFAGTAARRSRPERALRLAGAAAALRHSLGAVTEPAEQSRTEKDLEPARASLSNTAGAAAWMEGWGMAPEEAIREALKT